MCAAGVERAALSEDGIAYQKCLVEALEVLGETALPGEWSGNVTEDLERVRSLWIGLCDVEWRVDPVLLDSARPEIAVVVAEGVSNAYRHGDATHARVSVDQAGDVVRVEVIDNGSGPRDVEPGLGTVTLNRLSRGRVFLDSAPEGGRLRVDLPAWATRDSPP